MKRWIAFLLTLVMVFTATAALAEVALIGSTIYTGWYVNEVNFPDEIFREFLLSKCKVKDSVYGLPFLRDSVEINSLTSIDVSKNDSYTASWRKGNITSLKGIEYLTRLTSIRCGGNQIASIDVSERTNLTKLLASENQLASIDVSKNTKLEWLGVDGNKLTTIDVSANTGLTFLNTANNQLGTLDVSHNTELNEFLCYNNQLKTLDVSQNIKLEHLDCDTNQLTNLDVSKNTEMRDLSCWNNHLKTIDVSKNTNLTALDCSVNRITVLDVSACPALVELVKNNTRQHNDKENLDYFDAEGAWLMIDPWTKVIAGDTVSEATAPAPKDPVKPEEDDPEPDPKKPEEKDPDTPLVIGESFTSNGMQYKVVSDTAISFTKAAKTKNSVTVPETVSAGGKTYLVTEIAAKAFYKNTKVTSIIIGSNVKTIGKSAFDGCTKLKTVKGGASVEIIKDKAFNNCKVLKTFPVMNQLQSIGASAFKGCEKLAKFTLSSGVQSVGKSAFNGCKALKTITVKSMLLTTKNVKGGAFKGINAKATFKCPKEKRTVYKKLFLKAGAPKTGKFK